MKQFTASERRIELARIHQQWEIVWEEITHAQARWKAWKQVSEYSDPELREHRLDCIMPKGVRRLSDKEHRKMANEEVTDSEREIKKLRAEMQELEKESKEVKNSRKSTARSRKEEAALIKAYTDACATYNAEKPTLAQLKEISGVDGTTWSRKLKTGGFVLALRDALKKKVNYAKKDSTRRIWINAEVEVETKLRCLAKNLEQKRKRDRRGLAELSEKDIEE